MIRGYISAQLMRDQDEGPDKLLPFGAAQCATCGQILPEEELREIDGVEICGECLVDYCLTHCQEQELLYACAPTRLEDFASYFWRQIGPDFRAELVRSVLLSEKVAGTALYREAAHQYCVLHPQDFAAFCLEAQDGSG